ncbi:tetratricopeptide repeat protein [Myxococcota bacterium]|nr:tetratricopeptide repeat protein [Myxococcota bacterium]MBU1379504.1 tetratricopeptide repeat protein [Myxococcota bacterium]MBU1495731.1 tetratricopeptide repeat protein [Myxococcota bacterium]
MSPKSIHIFLSILAISLNFSCSKGLSAEDLQILRSIKSQQKEIATEIGTIKNRLLVLESRVIEHRKKKPANNGNGENIKEPDNLPETKLKPATVGELEEQEPEPAVQRKTKYKKRKGRIRLVLKGSPSGPVDNPHYIPTVKGDRVLRLGKFHPLKEPSDSDGTLGNSSVSKKPEIKSKSVYPAVKLGKDGDGYLYEQGMKWFRMARYELAVINFSKLVSTYPESPWVPNALFWQGESFYRKASYRNAINFYNKVIQLNKKGAKVPDATFKIGLSHYNLGDKKKGRQIISRLIETYPNSDVAARAATWLKKVR